MKQLSNIVVENASVNNLQAISIILKSQHYYVFTGPSGSGKSSLAFDVLYAEADRLGKARGVSKIFRHSSQLYQVNNLPEITVGIEQQIPGSYQLATVGWATGILEEAVKLQSKRDPSYCTKCSGRGCIRAISPERLIRNQSKPVTRGAVTPAVKTVAKFDLKWWTSFCKEKGVNPLSDFDILPHSIQNVLLYGNSKKFKGFIPVLTDLIGASKLPKTLYDEFPYYLDKIACPECHGSGLMESSLRWISQKTIYELLRSGLIRITSEETNWLEQLDIGAIPINQPMFRLGSMEARKLRFFSSIRGLKKNSLLIFDEPCAGLLPGEATKMCVLFRSLANAGHTMIVIEHSSVVVASADTIVAFGPGSGNEGGKIVFQGEPSTYSSYLQKKKSGTKNNPEEKHILSPPTKFFGGTFSEWFGFKAFEVKIPLGQLVCICGPSGSGKTAYLEAVYAIGDKTPVAWQGRSKLKERQGQDYIRRPHIITSETVGLHTGSTPSTFLGLWDCVRDIFANLPEAKKLCLTKSHFSFNKKEGQCSECHGQGFFNKDQETYIVCPTCQGNRYKDSLSKVQYCGKNIVDINKFTVRQASVLFKDSQRVLRFLNLLEYVALEYLVLGQPLNSLSGGETQRIKIVSELAKKLGDRSVYIFDIPSRGLDIQTLPRLSFALRGLVEKNNTVVIAENNPELIKHSDWIIVLNKNNGQHTLEISYSGPTGECPTCILEKIT